MVGLAAVLVALLWGQLDWGGLLGSRHTAAERVNVAALPLEERVAAAAPTLADRVNVAALPIEERVEATVENGTLLLQELARMRATVRPEPRFVKEVRFLRALLDWAVDYQILEGGLEREAEALAIIEAAAATLPGVAPIICKAATVLQEHAVERSRQQANHRSGGVAVGYPIQLSSLEPSLTAPLEACRVALGSAAVVERRRKKPSQKYRTMLAAVLVRLGRAKEAADLVDELEEEWASHHRGGDRVKHGVYREYCVWRDAARALANAVDEHSGGGPSDPREHPWYTDAVFGYDAVDELYGRGKGKNGTAEEAGCLIEQRTVPLSSHLSLEEKEGGAGDGQPRRPVHYVGGVGHWVRHVAKRTGNTCECGECMMSVYKDRLALDTDIIPPPPHLTHPYPTIGCHELDHQNVCRLSRTRRVPRVCGRFSGQFKFGQSDTRSAHVPRRGRI